MKKKEASTFLEITHAISLFRFDDEANKVKELDAIDTIKGVELKLIGGKN